MSAQTHAALDEAIRAHIADEYEGLTIVTDYAVLVAVQTDDLDSTSYYYACRDGMARHVLVGLVAWFQRKFQDRPTEDDA